jgi:hypothetical protein
MLEFVCEAAVEIKGRRVSAELRVAEDGALSERQKAKREKKH